MSQQTRIKVAVMGATGYTGQELVRSLVHHPAAELVAVTSRTYAGKRLSDVFPNLRKQVSVVCQDTNMEAVSKEADLVFLAMPHGEAASIVNSEILQSTRIIDLGADFRLEDATQYKEWYHLDHASPSLLPMATYGLCEFNGDAIVKSRLVANPGCYATCSILALTPLLKANLILADSIIIDAKSGVSGAGRGTALGSHFNECNESIKAYAVTTHRHTPEIEQELRRQSGQAVRLSFTPHLIPMNRGILVTAYASLLPSANVDSIKEAFSKSYDHCAFIRMYDPAEDLLPETRWVEGSNFCDIAFRVDKRTNRVIVIAALDNLVKGAAGQAIQNMNIMHGLDERTGLEHVPLFP